MSLSRLGELQGEMQKCFRCSLCKMVPLPTVLNSKYSDGCPSSRLYHFHGYSGSGKNIMALSLVDGRIEVDEALAEIAFACTACGLCDVSCKFIMEAERHEVNMALREHIVEEGFGLTAHRAAIDALKESYHPNRGPGDRVPKWAEDLGLKVLPAAKAQVLLFTGCPLCGDPDSQEVNRKLARLLQRAGVDFGILGDPQVSCGLPAYWTGHRDVFTEVATDMTGFLDSLGVETIVTTSGSCLGTMRSKYPEYASGPRPKLLHGSEFLADLVKKGRLRLTRPVRRSVTYHDPCYLGRQSEPPVCWEGELKVSHGCMTYADPPRAVNRGVSGVYDEPRSVLRAIEGLDFVEMYRIREYSYCCGGGGGVPQAYPELAQAAALHRLEEARDVGAECLVTACHQCRANLSRPQRSAGGGLPPVVDLIDLAYEAAGMQ